MRKLRWWHRWLGLVVLPLFILACLSGTILVYQKSIVRTVVTPDAEFPSSYGIDELAKELEALVQHPQFKKSALIKAPNPEEPYWSLRYTDGEKVLLRLGDLQPYTTSTWLLDVLEFIRIFHIELLTGLIGEAILLLVGISALFLCLSGVWLWWPGRRIFHWQWIIPPPSRWQLKWLLRFHNQSGIVLAPMLLLVMLTSSVMMFQKVKNALVSHEPPTSIEPFPKYAPSDVSAALHRVNNAVQNSWPTYIRFLPGETAKAKIRVRLQGEWHSNGRTNVFVDLDQLTIDTLQHADLASPLKKVLNQMYPLHSSYGMPALYALLVFITGIGGLWLSYTGGVSLLRRLSGYSHRGRRSGSDESS